MKTTMFELPVRGGFFHRDGIRSFLRALKERWPFPQLSIEADKKEGVLQLVFSEPKDTTTVLETVDDALSMVLTEEQQKKQCPVCGLGLIYGWTRLCSDCKQNQEEFTTLFELEPLIDRELDELELFDEYDIALAELDKLEETTLPSLFEIPFGDAQGAFPDEMVRTILRAAKIEYNASFEVGEESVIVTIPQGGLDEADLLALAGLSTPV